MTGRATVTRADWYCRPPTSSGTTAPTVVLTGGGSTDLGPVEGVDLVEPDLLLRGLGMFATLVGVGR